MSLANNSDDEVAHSLSEALDWRAGRTWLVFGGFAVFLGILSSAIIIGSDVMSQLVVRGGRVNIVAMALSLALHLGALFLLPKLIPLRNGDGEVVPGYRILGKPPLDVLPSFWRYFAWVGVVSLVASFAIRQQPFFVLTASIPIQAVIPIFFAMFTAQFPASVLVARSRAAPPPSGPETAAKREH